MCRARSSARRFSLRNSLFTKTVQNSIIGKVNHVIQLIFWKISQIDGVPVRLLNRWTMVATNNLARVNHPIKVSYISGAF